MAVYIMQGIPGSGKSTLARRIERATIVSADRWFERNGEYHFRPDELPKAHAACLRQFIGLASNGGFSDIVVDNTNIRAWEMAPYVAIARAWELETHVIRLTCNPMVAARRCVHRVPDATIMRMVSELEDPPSAWRVIYHVLGGDEASNFTTPVRHPSF
jgi:predicted kinase